VSGPLDPTPFTDRLLGLALKILSLVLVLYFAIRLLEEVAPVLIGIGVVIVMSVVVWVIYRKRRSDW